MSIEKPSEHNAESIGEAARRLLASRAVGDESLRTSATVGRPIPVLHPNLQLHSWFVPLTIDNRLAAFFQLLRDGTLMRFSSFPTGSDEAPTWPEAADWLDTARIQTRAVRHSRTGETPHQPFLSYDRNPDRLVWAVPFSNERGDERLIFVVGETVYEPPPSGTFG